VGPMWLAPMCALRFPIVLSSLVFRNTAAQRLEIHGPETLRREVTRGSSMD